MGKSRTGVASARMSTSTARHDTTFKSRCERVSDWGMKGRKEVFFFVDGDIKMDERGQIQISLGRKKKVVGREGVVGSPMG